MFNTFGLHSVNLNTFQNSFEKSILVMGTDIYRVASSTFFLEQPRAQRNVQVTFLRIHNLSLNILGYLRCFPTIPMISGSIRIGVGVVLAAVTLAIGNPHATNGPIVGHFYGEALSTAVAQIARGILEAFVPFGWVVNASLDLIGTGYNAYKCINHPSQVDWRANGRINEDPCYPIPLWPLYLA